MQPIFWGGGLCRGLGLVLVKPWSYLGVGDASGWLKNSRREAQMVMRVFRGYFALCVCVVCLAFSKTDTM